MSLNSDNFLFFTRYLLQLRSKKSSSLGFVSCLMYLLKYHCPCSTGVCLAKANMNPSPSGYFNNGKSGSVTSFEMQHYFEKIYGPLLYRIDLNLEVEPVRFEKLS